MRGVLEFHLGLTRPRELYQQFDAVRSCWRVPSKARTALPAQTGRMLQWHIWIGAK